jgi:hypothetical protein
MAELENAGTKKLGKSPATTKVVELPVVVNWW